MKTTALAQNSPASALRQPRRSHKIDLVAEEARLRNKIAALQAKQRRQRLEEDLRPSTRKSKTGIRFASAFLIVMAIHVAAIGGFYGVSSIRKMNASDKLGLNAKAPVYTGVPEPAAKPINDVPLSDPSRSDVVHGAESSWFPAASGGVARARQAIACQLFSPAPFLFGAPVSLSSCASVDNVLFVLAVF